MALANMITRVMSPPTDGDSRIDLKMEEDNAKPALTPPTSEGTKGNPDDSGSELSDLEPDPPPKVSPTVEPKVEPKQDEDGDITPDHYYDGGRVPVFKPTMNQFRSFKDFIGKIDKYGMKSGIVKVVPPKEWRDSLPALDEQVKTIKVKNPITQEFHGTHGTYTQANMEKQRSYNLPQWRSLCEESNHQPPAKRGERRRNQDKPSQARLTRIKNETPAMLAAQKKRPGRPRVRPLRSAEQHSSAGDADSDDSSILAPPTPTSPLPKVAPKGKKVKRGKAKAPKEDDELKGKGRQPKSVGSRRLHNKRDLVDYVDEEAFKEFDYRIYNQDEWTTERVQELETAYWRSLNFNNPMYGADMPGSLFDDSTREWNVAKLENLLDVLGQKVPGVNTAYLYLGMWKASFAWHLEDVDLYSINYIHFGAPKQWYSISQEDARRFESAMKSVWPTDAKNCDQFLRHKTYLISPQLLQSQYNIRVNRLVHNEGEFVITFPYGYHSGYNLGYNCAESVNFATESWLDFGKVARKCHCEADSVWVDVREIERKLRGEPTPEYYEETDDDDDEEDEEESGLPTPPGSVKGKPKRPPKRKRGPNDKSGKPKVKKLKIRIKAPAYEPCILCPNDNQFEELLPTDNGQRAHRRCGLYTPETYVSEEPDGTSIVRDIVAIDKARLELKCNYCRSRKGSVFQCSSKKCTKAYHATCAMAAGIQIDIGPTSVYGEDGTEYVDTGYDFRCRIHRSKRSKNADSWNLENNDFIYSKAKKLSNGEAVQAQFYQSDIIAGVVVENKKSEQSVLLEMLPRGDKVEVEWKWLLFFDPLNSQLPVPSENAKPLPADMLRRSRTSAEDPAARVDGPKVGEDFCDLNSIYKWSEFESCRPFHNRQQVEVDISKPDQLWYFLGEKATDAKQYYTHDPAIRVHNPKSNFLEIEKLKALAESMKASAQQRSQSYNYGTVNQHAINAARANNPMPPATSYCPTNTQSKAPVNKERPYNGKYAITDSAPLARYKSGYGINVDAQALHNQRMFQQRASMGMNAAQVYRPNLYPYDRQSPARSFHPPPANTHMAAPTAPMMPTTAQTPGPLPYQPPIPYGFDAGALLKKVNLSSDDNIQRAPTQPHAARPPQPQSHSHSPYPPPQAPVANMMSSVPREVARPQSQEAVQYRRPSYPNVPQPARSTTPVTAANAAALRNTSVLQSAQTRKNTPLPNVNPTYAYLHDAEKARPLIYQSPYAPGGGFTEPYLPVPESTVQGRPRGPSISDAYLMARSPSEQGAVTAKMDEDKAKLLESTAIRRRQSAGQSQMPRPQYMAHQHHHSQPAHLPMSMIQGPSQTHNPQSSQSYFDPHLPPSYTYPTNYHHNQPYAYQTAYANPHHQPPNQYNQHQLHYQQHSDDQYATNPSPLNFQSPHDFQAQMMHEAHRSPAQDASLDRFSQELKNVAHGNDNSNPSRWYTNNERPPSSSGQPHAPGHAGSPLKHEFGNGGEMLPMMPEGRRY